MVRYHAAKVVETNEFGRSQQVVLGKTQEQGIDHWERRKEGESRDPGTDKGVADQVAAPADGPQAGLGGRGAAQLSRAASHAARRTCE